MTIDLLYPLALALMGMLLLWTLPNGPPNVIFITITTILFGVGSLLVYSGVSIWLALGTFIAACAMLPLGIWRADAEKPLRVAGLYLGCPVFLRGLF